MTTEKIKALFSACYKAKRVRDMLPALPEGVSSAHIQYLDIIERFESNGMRVRVSDIGDALNIPRPGVTRTVKEMEKLGYIKKLASEADGRVVYLTATEEGRKLSETYNERFFAMLMPLLSDISDGDADIAVSTIEKLYKTMSERKITLEYR